MLGRSDITSVGVENALAEAQSSKKCLLHPPNEQSQTQHAAKVLKFVFDHLTTTEYHKTSHGPKIANWLIANKPEAFMELKGWFRKFLHAEK